jgi:hypothetical protein
MQHMMTKYYFLLLLLLVLGSCTISRIYPQKYYNEHKDLLHQTETLYENTSHKKSFALGFTSLDFTSVSIELKTDTVRYIYDFNIDEARMNDTLSRFGYDSTSVQQVIANMKALRSTWINTLDYYVDGRPGTVSFISIPLRQFSFFPLMQKRKYYVYTFYDRPQFYDEQDRLLDRRSSKRLRKINGQTFHRINDRVSYTISGKFR